VAPFLAIDAWLRGLDLSAPEVLAADPAGGFLLLEDLGDDLFARLAACEPAMETPIYEEAVRVILRLRNAEPPEGAPVYDLARLAKFAALAAETYAGTDPAPFADALRGHLAPLDRPESLSLRDYHAENLLWLPDRKGIARVGLLDFQDALLAHQSFDLVSLLEDARRDVSPSAAEACRRLYLDETGEDAARFARDCALCGAQRNLRIIGVFARLSLTAGKPRYLDLVPRVWQHLARDLATPGLEELRRLVLDVLPPPTDAHLASLRPAA